MRCGATLCFLLFSPHKGKEKNLLYDLNLILSYLDLEERELKSLQDCCLEIERDHELDTVNSVPLQ